MKRTKKVKRARRKKKDIKRCRIIGITLILLSTIFIQARVSQYQMTKEISSQKRSLEMEISRIEKEISQLENDIEISQTLEFVEKTAREDYNMIKPREVIYIFNDDNQ